MKLMSAHVENLRSLYMDNLQKALDMERQIAHSLPKLAEHTTDSTLADAFRTHKDETEGHAATIESILRKHLGDSPSKTCKAMSGLATEASDIVKDATNPTVRDIALIGAAQQVEHHEIAVYGTLRRWAELLEFEEDARMLETIEAEEEDTDAVLTDIAARVNREGAEEQAEEDRPTSRREEKRPAA